MTQAALAVPRRLLLSNLSIHSFNPSVLSKWLRAHLGLQFKVATVGVGFSFVWRVVLRAKEKDLRDNVRGEATIMRLIST